MKLGKLLFSCGVALAIWAIISSVSFNLHVDDLTTTKNFGYSLNLTKLAIGVALIFIGRKMQKNETK